MELREKTSPHHIQPTREPRNIIAPTMTLLGVLVASVVCTFAAIGLVAIAIRQTAFVPSTSADVASWIQAGAAFVAILSAAGVALVIQRRDHLNQRRGPTESALSIARYSLERIEQFRSACNSKKALGDVADQTVYFDIDGIHELPRIVNSLPLHELRNGEATTQVLALNAIVRQLSRNVRIAFEDNNGWPESSFDNFTDVLRRISEATAACVNGLESALKKM
ncbi:hypothetical protein LMG1861_05092 [Achromobacter piechaudii]|uniref:Uncharacterized protein n=1 Tax=Achromobacter piechaudii TaxID=72556 RepID=A0A6S7EN46_9BURK|nr:hypothetical protein LMG1861_05092 [Achromobacter piechaudii]